MNDESLYPLLYMERLGLFHLCRREERVLRIFLVKGKVLAAAAGLLALLAIVLFTTAPEVISAATASKQLPIYCVKTEEKKVSLTFDAAWGNEDTQQLIDILGQYDVKATFFVVGAWAEKYPESVKALHDAGHEVMTHSDDHDHMTQLTRDEIIEDINESCDKIETITGVRPDLFRAPFGDYDDKVIETLTSMKMYTIQWDVDSLDWKDLSAEEIKKRVLDRVKPGSIVLFHNAALHTPEALPGIIENLQKQGYEIVPASRLIYRDNYEMDHTGMQVPHASPKAM